MTDRELLELAAKAAGYAVEVDMAWGTGGVPFYRLDGGKWNPLKDDGQCLRLAVATSKRMDNGLLIMPPDKFDEWAIVRDWNAEIGYGKSCDQDPCAATRRAVVGAAAELGKALP